MHKYICTIYIISVCVMYICIYMYLQIKIRICDKIEYDAKYDRLQLINYYISN